MSGKQYVYTRGTEDQKLLVVCSFSDRPTKMKVPGDFPLAQARLVLSNHRDQGTTLPPYGCRVYLWEKGQAPTP